MLAFRRQFCHTFVNSNLIINILLSLKIKLQLNGQTNSTIENWPENIRATEFLSLWLLFIV